MITKALSDTATVFVLKKEVFLKALQVRSAQRWGIKKSICLLSYLDKTMSKDGTTPVEEFLINSNYFCLNTKAQ